MIFNASKSTMLRIGEVKSSQVGLAFNKQVTIAAVLQQVQNYAQLIMHRIKNELNKLNK